MCFARNQALARSLAKHVAKPSSWAAHAPGKKYLYSNFASSLAAVLVERHSGMDFTAFTQSFIFGPLGMTRTSWFRPTDGTASTRKHPCPPPLLRRK